MVLLSVALFATNSSLAQENHPLNQEAEAIARDILATFYPEFDSEKCPVTINVDEKSNHSEYYFGASIDQFKRIFDPSRAAPEPPLKLSVGVKQGKVMSFLAKGGFIQDAKLERVRNEIVTHNFSPRQALTYLRKSGGHWVPPKYVSSADLSKRLERWFPGIVLSRGEFEYGPVTADYRRPELTWKFVSLPKRGLSKEEVVLRIEPFGGRVLSFYDLSRAP
jgi:hypothetical protein